jgi:hypothetical protein
MWILGQQRIPGIKLIEPYIRTCERVMGWGGISRTPLLSSLAHATLDKTFPAFGRGRSPSGSLVADVAGGCNRRT